MARMVIFLKSMDNKTWKAIIKGWEHPVLMDKDGKATTTVKPEEEWSKDEDGLALGNSKALNALFTTIDKNMFRLINTCIVAKDAREILRTTHEGTSCFGPLTRLHVYNITPPQGFALKGAHQLACTVPHWSTPPRRDHTTRVHSRS